MKELMTRLAVLSAWPAFIYPQLDYSLWRDDAAFRMLVVAYTVYALACLLVERDD